jgi:hypothetical protein
MFGILGSRQGRRRSHDPRLGPHCLHPRGDSVDDGPRSMTQEQKRDLAERVVTDAIANLGVSEQGHSNAGKWVEVYLRFVDLPPGNPWCAAFAVYRAYRAAKELGLTLTLPKTGSSSELYRWAKKNGALCDPYRGCLAVVKGGRTGHRHTCIVERVEGDYVATVDGNDDDMVRRDRRRIVSCDFLHVL